ncbi:unnamed protein product [Aspergillus oryzae var. brunneus]|nr:unnamed protein product [Aspergillus oryzae]GMG34620.1 unnamed protein product [Aspergillus oryzae]GMG50282.1 unnamed protein product [Aspergillus oryzae var. brunneus]
MCPLSRGTLVLCSSRSYLYLESPVAAAGNPSLAQDTNTTALDVRSQSDCDTIVQPPIHAITICPVRLVFVTMSTNRPFLANFLAAFRAQSTYKASAAGSQSATTSSSLSPTQISQSARAIATKASNSGASSEAASTTHYHHHHHHHHHSSSAGASHSRPHSHTRSPLNQSSPAGDSPVPSSSATPPAPSSPPTPASSNPIPIANGPDRQRRGSDSSNGSGGFRDALGPEKWYIGGRTPGGEERFYRLGMVTKGGGRLGGSGRVGSIDQLSL